MSAKRRRLLATGKLKPKRTRLEIKNLPIWPRGMPGIFTTVKMHGPEQRTLREIAEHRQQRRQYIHRDGAQGVEFLTERNDGTVDDRDPHMPQPVEGLTDDENHWFESPDNET